MRRGRSVIISLASCLLGCQLTPTFTTGYELDDTPVRDAPLAGTLAVRSFVEARPERYYNTTGRLFLTYVPLLPYVTLRWERIEESVRIQSEAIDASGRGLTLGAAQAVAPPFEEYYYPNSFAEAVARDLEATGIFSRVSYVADGPTTGSDFLLAGTLRATPLRSSTSSFGLGAAGVLLWLLPVPISKTTVELQLEIELTDLVRNRLVWKRILSSEVHRYYSLYTSSAMVYGRGGAFSFNLMPPPSDSRVDRRSLFSWHFEAFRRAMRDTHQELALALEGGS
jgi:hypothetical protein